MRFCGRRVLQRSDQVARSSYYVRIHEDKRPKNEVSFDLLIVL